MAGRRWGQSSQHNVLFRDVVSEVFMLLSLATGPSLVSYPGYLSVPRSITCSLSCSSVLVSFFSVFLSLSPSNRLLLFLQSEEPLFDLLFLQWNTKSQPDGSSHKFQASVKFLSWKEKTNTYMANTPAVGACLWACCSRREKSCLKTAPH